MTPAPALDPIDLLINKLPYCPVEDRALLRDLFDRFPKVLAGYQEFVAIEPARRILQAGEKLERLPRSGWLRFDVELSFRDVLDTHGVGYLGSRYLFSEDAPYLESVLAHSAEAQEVFLLVYNDYPHLQWGAEVMKFHDFVEAINGDFTPLDNISKDEKKFLEKVALELLTESRKNGDLLAKHIYHCMRIFEGEEQSYSDLSHEMRSAIEAKEAKGALPPHQAGVVNFFKQLYSPRDIDLSELRTKAVDTDCLQMLLVGTRIMKGETYRIDYFKALQEFRKFIDYIGGKIQTPEAKRFFAIFNKFFPHTDLYRELVMECFAEYAHDLSDARGF